MRLPVPLLAYTATAPPGRILYFHYTTKEHFVNRKIKIGGDDLLIFQIEIIEKVIIAQAVALLNLLNNHSVTCH